MSYKNPSSDHDYPIAYVVYNRMLSLLSDKDFVVLLNTLRKDMHKTGKTPSIESRVSTKRIVRGFVHKKELPLNWVDPIYNIIREEDFRLDFPFEEGIKLMVGDDVITANNPEQVTLLEKKGERSSARKITIEISNDISSTRLIKFIKTFAPVIKGFQEFLDLPPAHTDKRKKAEIALWINDMRVNKGMTFAEMADTPEMEALEIFDEATIRNIYKRYKDLL